MIVDPLGEIKAKCEDDPSIVYSEISLKYQEEVRKRFVVYDKRRTDLYSVKLHK